MSVTRLLSLSVALVLGGPSCMDASEEYAWNRSFTSGSCAAAHCVLVSDGCCPTGCNWDSDADCPTLCGNGALNRGELCDGDCPTSCPAGADACHPQLLEGAASSCDAQCRVVEITACEDGDGCCAIGCDYDQDCCTGCLDFQRCDSSVCRSMAPEPVSSAHRSLLALALDASGTPHLAIVGEVEEEDHLYYASHDGTDWNVTEPAVPLGGYVDLAVATDARPVIAYGLYDRIGIARFDGTDWGLDEVASGDDMYLALALDSDDGAHLVYLDSTNDSLKYASPLADSWTFESIVDGPNVGAGCDLVLDDGGVPHVSYYDVQSDAVRYAYRSGGEWLTELVDTLDAHAGVGTSKTAIALDSSGSPHIAYGALGDYELRYAARVGSAWTPETISDLQSQYGGYPSLAVDASGRAFVSYWGEGTAGEYDRLCLAVRRGSEDWALECLDPFAYDGYGRTGYGTALVLTAAGTAWVCGAEASKGVVCSPPP